MLGLAYTAQDQPVLLFGHVGYLEDLGDVLAVNRLGSPLNNVCPKFRRSRFDSTPRNRPIPRF